MAKPKTWLECTREEKVQRMIENAESCVQIVKDLKEEIADVTMEIETNQEDAIRFRKQARLIAAGETEEPARP